MVVGPGNGGAGSTTGPTQSRSGPGNGIRTTAARKEKHVVIDDDAVPHRPKMVRVPTKAEFNPKDLEDEEEEGEEEEGEEDMVVKNPAITRTKYSDAGLPLDPNDSAAAPAHTYYAPPRAQPAAAAQRREGRVTPPLPLPQPKNILKKVSAYQLPPPCQPPTLNGGNNTNNCSNSSGQASSRGNLSRGNSSRGNSSTHAPPLGVGPARRSMRQLSFADELGRELHEVTHAHNLQYASNYRQSAPLACCIVS